MTSELTPEEAEAAKATNRALLAPLVALGLGGTEPLACSLESLASGLREHAAAIGAVDGGFTSYAFQVATVLDGLDRRLRTLVAVNAATPADPAPEPEV